VFAAGFGAVLMGDRIGATGLLGCALILACVLLVQLQPLVWRWIARPSARLAP
jgi:drug/metabolite transporter (DMT)-like permease